MNEEEKQSLRIPAWCPICDLFMRDHRTYWKWGCCGLCFIEFVEHREERWEAGWRPSKDEVDRFVKRLHP